MREALEEIDANEDDDNISQMKEVVKMVRRMALLARDALSTSTDYANKVVVDREEWGELLALEAANRIFAGIPDDDEHNDEIDEMGGAFVVALTRLDSLRKGGGE